MKRALMAGLFLLGSAVAGLAFQQPAQPPPPSQSSPSLADYARKLKEQQDKAARNTKPARVYTNDDVQVFRAGGGVTVASQPAEGAGTKPTATGAHDEKYYTQAYSKLMAQKELHERELDVLQKKLSQNQVQYYPDPSKAMQQEYSRSDITQKQADVNAKQLEIQADDKAISDLQDQLRRDGGDPAWLRVVPLSPAELAGASTPEGPAAEDKNPEDKKKTKEYWQAQFKSARVAVAKAEEMQRLVEDEINLLKQRQVQEPSMDAQTEIAQKLAAKQPELDTATAATEKAKKALDDLQKKFADSGAPPDWSSTD